MKKFITVILALNLLAVGAFGFWGLGMLDHANVNTDCPISLGSADCPPVDGSMAVHHATGLQNLLQVTLGSKTTLTIISALLLAVLVMAIFNIHLYGSFIRRLFSAQYQVPLLSACSPRKQFLYWSALLNKKSLVNNEAFMVVL